MNRHRIVSLFATLAVALGTLFAAPAALADSPWRIPKVPSTSSPADGYVPADSPWSPEH